MMKAMREKLFPLGLRVEPGVPFYGSLNFPSAQLAGGFFLYFHFLTNLPPASETGKIAAERYSLMIAPGEIFAVHRGIESITRSRESFG